MPVVAETIFPFLLFIAIAVPHAAPEANSPWSRQGSVSLDLSTSQRTDQDAWNGDPYIETGATGSLSLDWGIDYDGSVSSHSIFLGLGLDASSVFQASGTGSETTDTDPSGTFIPGIGYAWFGNSTNATLWLDWIYSPEEGGSPGAAVSFTRTLHRTGNGTRWNLGLVATWSQSYADKITLKTEWRPKGETLEGRLGLFAKATQDTALDLGDTLYLGAQWAGGGLQAGLTWKPGTWTLGISGEGGYYTGLENDRWTSTTDLGALQHHTYRNTRRTLGAQLGLGHPLGPLDMSLGLSVGYQDYPGIPETHPEAYHATTTSWGGDIGLEWPF